VSDLRGDRRLAGAGGAADQHDQRHVELVEIAVAAQALDRFVTLDRPSVSIASSCRRSSSTTRSSRLAKSISTCRASS